MVLETTFTTAGGSVTLTDALAVGRNERGHELGAGAVGTVLRRVVGVAGSVDLELAYAPRPEYGLVSPAAAGRRRRGHRPRWRRRAGAVVAGAARDRRVHRPGPLHGAGRRGAGLRTAPPDDVRGAAPPLDADGDPRPAGRHRRGVAHLVEPPPALRRPVGRPRAHERPGAVRADLLPHRRHRGRAHHVAPRGAGRLAQLGLPLRLGARRVVHAPGAVGRRLSRRGRQVLRVHGRAPRRRRSARAPTSRSCSASGASTI